MYNTVVAMAAQEMQSSQSYAFYCSIRFLASGTYELHFRNLTYKFSCQWTFETLELHTNEHGASIIRINHILSVRIAVC